MASSLCRPTCSFLTPRRLFSSTSHALGRSDDSALAHKHRHIPPPPFPPSRWYKKSNFGLYGGAVPQWGNKVSAKNEIKTRKRWDLNVHNKRLWSDSLGKFVRVKVLARVLRTIDKVGGLDEYLMGEKSARIKELGWAGWALRWRVMRTEKMQARFAEQRKMFGLPPRDVEEMVKRESEAVKMAGGESVLGTMEVEEEDDTRAEDETELAARNNVARARSTEDETIATREGKGTEVTTRGKIVDVVDTTKEDIVKSKHEDLKTPHGHEVTVTENKESSTKASTSPKLEG